MKFVSEKLYYIYIDTKTIGAIEQLTRYFQTQVFTHQSCICVLCKYYSSIERIFTNKFKEHNINFKFIKKHSDIQLEEDKTVLYLFNAQSNCRIAANRNLTHIFVTHGESHKLASVKPIIRIYDYVVTSGQVGIDRYIKSGIFSRHDIDNGKVVTLGSTFIGGSRYIYDRHSPALVYAPTWEGGIPEEDYCSISISNTRKIITFCLSNQIDTVYLQAHPNIGHRIKSKKNELYHTIKTLKNAGLTVYMIGEHYKRNKFIFLFQKKTPSLPNELPVKYALTDISAMEAQFIHKGIPCSVFAEEQKLSNLIIPRFLKSHYRDRFIFNDDIIINPAPPLSKKIFDYFFSYPLGLNELTPLYERLYWLCKKTSDERNHTKKQLIDCI